MAKDLFDPRYFPELGFDRFGPCHEVVPYLRAAPEGSLEKALQQLQEEGNGDPHRLTQLAAVRYYLRYLLLAHAHAWRVGHGGVTNHRTLLDQVRRATPQHEPVWLVTFNYDRLIEESLPSVGLRLDPGPYGAREDLREYVIHPKYRLVKLHGSVDWGHPVSLEAKSDAVSSMAALIEMHFRPGELGDRFQQVTAEPGEQGALRLGLKRIPLFPAIAIPTEAKSHFECPTQHLDALKTSLGGINRLVVIGWRATENHFLDVLKEGLKSPVKALAVCGTAEEGDAALARLRNAVSSLESVESFPGGFSEFVVSRMLEKFAAPT